MVGKGETKLTEEGRGMEKEANTVEYVNGNQKNIWQSTHIHILYTYDEQFAPVYTDAHTYTHTHMYNSIVHEVELFTVKVQTDIYIMSIQISNAVQNYDI